MPIFREKRMSMPIGMLYSWWAPISSEPANSHPVYGDVLDMGHARVGNLTVATAVADIPGDDQIVYHVEKFLNGTLAAETDLDDLTTNAQIYGRTRDASGVHSNKNDSAPAGAYGYIEPMLQPDGTVKYRTTFLWKIQANLANYTKNSQTRGTSFDPRTNAISYTIMPDKTGDWQLEEEFTTESAAINWVMALFGAVTTFSVTPIVVGTGTVSPAAAAAYAAGSNVVLTFSADPDALYDNGADVTASIAAGHRYTISSIASDHQVVAIFEVA